MIILDERVPKAYPNRILNVHPALIPSFCGPGFYGLKVHEAALAAGVKLTGATVHFVSEVCDGGPIILQGAVPVKYGDTPEILQRRVMEEVEWKLLPKAAALFLRWENYRGKRNCICERIKYSKVVSVRSRLDRRLAVWYTESGDFCVTDGFVENHIGARKVFADRLGSLVLRLPFFVRKRLQGGFSC